MLMIFVPMYCEPVFYFSYYSVLYLTVYVHSNHAGTAAIFQYIN